MTRDQKARAPSPPPKQVSVLPSAQLRDGQARSTFATFYNSATSGAVKGGARNMRNLTSGQIGSTANRWRGSNYGGWSSPELDLLWDQFNSTLDHQGRNRQVVQMARLASEALPVFNLYFNFNVSAHTAAVVGSDPQAVDTLVNWNIHDWELRGRRPDWGQALWFPSLGRRP